MMDDDAGDRIVETEITLAVVRRKDGHDVEVAVNGRRAVEPGLTGVQAQQEAASFLYAMADVMAVPASLAQRGRNLIGGKQGGGHG